MPQTPQDIAICGGDGVIVTEKLPDGTTVAHCEWGTRAGGNGTVTPPPGRWMPGPRGGLVRVRDRDAIYGEHGYGEGRPPGCPPGTEKHWPSGHPGFGLPECRPQAAGTRLMPRPRARRRKMAALNYLRRMGAQGFAVGGPSGREILKAWCEAQVPTPTGCKGLKGSAGAPRDRVEIIQRARRGPPGTPPGMKPAPRPKVRPSQRMTGPQCESWCDTIEGKNSPDYWGCVFDCMKPRSAQGSPGLTYTITNPAAAQAGAARGRRAAARRLGTRGAASTECGQACWGLANKAQYDTCIRNCFCQQYPSTCAVLRM